MTESVDFPLGSEKVSIRNESSVNMDCFFPSPNRWGFFVQRLCLPGYIFRTRVLIWLSLYFNLDFQASSSYGGRVDRISTRTREGVVETGTHGLYSGVTCASAITW